MAARSELMHNCSQHGLTTLRDKGSSSFVNTHHRGQHLHLLRCATGVLSDDGEPAAGCGVYSAGAVTNLVPLAATWLSGEATERSKEKPEIEG